MKQVEPISRGRFTLGSDLVYQQDLAEELENYLKTKHPDLARDFDDIFPRPANLKTTLGERMAIRCCLPITMHRYLQSAGLLKDVPLMEYIDKMWASFSLTGSKNWSRPVLTILQ